MTEEQCKKCKWSFIDEFWGEDCDEMWWYDCDNKKIKDIDERLGYLDDVPCPFFESKY